MTTHTTEWAGWRVFSCRLLLGLGLVLAGFTLRAADERFDILETANGTYTNATVLTKTRTDIFIQHVGGVANVKLRDIDDGILTQLGYQVAPKKEPMNPLAVPTQILTNVTQQLEANPQFQALEQKWQTEMQPKLPPISKGLVLGVLAGLFLCYLFFCHCCKLIVRKTSHNPGLLVWIPILQLIPLLRAAGMSPVWFLVWVSPVLAGSLAFSSLRDGGSGPLFFILPIFQLASLAVSVVWIFRIVSARGKSLIWAVLLLLPVVNVIAFLYLAFSNGEEQQRFRVGPPPLAKAA